MSARKAVVIPLTFDAKFNSVGNLVPADHLDSPEGIYLPATDSTEFDTTGWSWTATFEIKDADTGHTIQIDPITFQVPVGSELDLSTIVPAPASPGVITTRGPKGLDGSNVLPTNDAVAQAIETEGPTKNALSAAIDGSVAPKLDKTEAAITYATNTSVTTEIAARVDPLVAAAIAADPTVANAAAAAVNANPTIATLSGTVAYLEDRVAIKSLGDTHLDTVTEPGEYMQLSSSRATEANGYPTTGVTTGTAGPLNVTTHSGMIYQTYHMILGGAVFGRYQSPAGTWFPWESVGKIRVVPLGDADLDTVTGGAFYAQQFNGGATESRNYPPDSGAGFLIPVDLGGGVVYHFYVNPLLGKIWTRRKYVSSWSEWVNAGGDLTQVRDEFIAADSLILADAKAYTDSKPSGVTQAELESSATATRNLAIAGDQTLSNRADGHETRLEALEILGEITPGDVSDATNQSLLANPASGTAQGVAHKIFGEVADPGTETGAYLEGTFMRTDQALSRFPTSTGVRRLITDPNARAVLQPGDFLLAPPSPTHRTSFYKTPVGAPVKGWTPRWGSTDWTVEADTEALGGKVLSGVAPSGTSLLTFDKTPVAKDVEVLARWKATAGAANLRVIFHTSDDYATRNGHTIYLSATGTISWWTWEDGVTSGGTGESIDPLPAGEWWMTRTRFYNQSMYFKAWPDTQPEPSEWSATVPRSTVLPEGRIGIGTGGPGTLHVDWATLALSGGIAPDMEA